MLFVIVRYVVSISRTRMSQSSRFLPNGLPVSGQARRAVGIVPAAVPRAYRKPARLPGSNAIPAGSPRYLSSPDLRRYVRVQAKQVLRIVLGPESDKPLEVSAVIFAIACHRDV